MNAETKNIVFDWNCTLLDDTRALYDCTNLLLQSEGHAPLTMEDFQHNYNVPFHIFYQRMGFTEAQVERMMSLENRAFHDHYEPLADQTALRDGAAEILQHARQNGVSAVILSNHITGPIRAQLKRLAIEHLFTAVLAYADRATQFRDMTKGERLRRFMIERRAKPEGTIIIGDTVEEIEIARAQGLVSVAITGGCVSEKRLRDEKPDHVIHSLHELKPILQERGFVS